MEQLVNPIRHNFEGQRTQATFRIACVFVLINSVGGILGQVFASYDAVVRQRNALAVFIGLVVFLTVLILIQSRISSIPIRQGIYSAFVVAAYFFPLFQNGAKSIILVVAITAAILPFLLIQLQPAFLIAFGVLHLLVTGAWWFRLPSLSASFSAGFYVYVLCGFLTGVYTVWEGIRLFRRYEAELLGLVRGIDERNTDLTALNEEFQATQDTLQVQYDEILLLQRQAESLMDKIQAIHNTAHEGLVDCERATGISLLSRNAVTLLGMEAEGFEVDHYGWFRFPCGAVPHLSRLWETLRHQHPDAMSLGGDLVIQDHPLGRRELHVTFLCYHIRGEADEHVLASLLDVTTEREQERHIRLLAFNDPLTGLLNRAGFEEAVGRLVSEKAPPFAVAVFNLRDFRSLNETLGYSAGNDVLGRIARLLGAHPGLIAHAARIGGDDFAFVIPDPEQTATVKALLIDSRTNFGTDAAELYLGINLGVSLFPDHSRKARDLLQDAELAMVLSQEKGPNEMQCYDTFIRDGVRRRVLLSGALERALERDEISLAYQPVVRADTLTPIGFEALVRWHSGKHGTVPPDVFIRIAESNGLIHRIGLRVLEEACRFSAILREAGHPLPVSVNVSGVQLLQADFAEQFLDTLAQTATPTGAIAVEVTETAVIDNLDQAVEHLSRLQAQGVRIYLDDFGTGYSSLSYLGRLPVNVLKIDKHFIRESVANPRGQGLIATMLDLSRHLGLDAVAEGIEDEYQLDALRALGCPAIQGYFVAKPMPGPTAADWLTARARLS